MQDRQLSINDMKELAFQNYLLRRQIAQLQAEVARLTAAMEVDKPEPQEVD